MSTTEDPATALKRVGQLDDHAVPLGETALLLAGLDHPAVDLAPYRAHFIELTQDAVARLGPVRAPQPVAGALAEVIANKHGYFGDSISYDDMQNADLIRVIDRRRGLPVALGILYLETAARLGVPCQGLNAPGHFVISIGQGEAAVVADPFNGGVVLGPLTGDGRPELSPVSRRDVLLRLINNIRSRARDPNRILSLSERMILLAPKRADLWLDVARASESVGKLRNATGAFQAVIKIAGVESALGREAAIALNAVRRRLN
jgi:regulator of sirC expression with transglutaminase-like and TPR domain